MSKKSSTFEHLPWLLFYVCANPPSGDLSGAALEVPSEALLHHRSYVRIMPDIVVPSDAALCLAQFPRKYVRIMPDILQHARFFLKNTATPSEAVSLPTLMQVSFQRVAEKLLQ